MDDPPSVYDLDRAALVERLAALGQPAYRADQVRHWLYGRLADDWSAMTDLPVALRRELAGKLSLGLPPVVARTDSEDRLATKHLFRLDDGQLIEAVLMHYLDPADAEEPRPGAIPPGRHTVCLSTQAGCAMGCVFCATGQMGLVRNLRLGECLAQVVTVARSLARDGQRLSNVVFMGMGEPLANWPATWGTVETLIDPLAFGLSPRRLTISTVGIVPGILRLAEMAPAVRLAVSIHAPDDALRSALVPVNAVYPLAEVLAACRTYQARTGRRITVEYVLIAGVNDRPGEARALGRLLAPLHAHVNLIPLNPTAGSDLAPSSPRDAAAFRRQLEAAGLAVTLRQRRGIEIRAGCGQLRSRAADGRLGRALEVAVPAR
jgi:23S rRNA (adenine2503-C2)-methyltransferase